MGGVVAIDFHRQFLQQILFTCILFISVGTVFIFTIHWILSMIFVEYSLGRKIWELTYSPTARFGRCHSLFHAIRCCSTQRLGRYISKIWSPWKQDPYLSYHSTSVIGGTAWWFTGTCTRGSSPQPIHRKLHHHSKSCIPTSEDARSDGLSVMASACLSDWQMAWQRALLHAGLPELVSCSWSEIEIPGS